MNIDITKAHEYSHKNKKKIRKSKLCGCYYCLKIFSNLEIKDWIKEDNDYTALCPYCGIDSVIGDNSKYEINDLFLKKLNDYWF